MENNNLVPATTPEQQALPAVAMSASESAAFAMAAAQKATVEARYKMALARPRDIDIVRQAMLKDANRSSFARVAIYHKHLAGFTDKGYELAAKAVVKAVLTGRIAHLKVEY